MFLNKSLSSFFAVGFLATALPSFAMDPFAEAASSAAARPSSAAAGSADDTQPALGQLRPLGSLEKFIFDRDKMQAELRTLSRRALPYEFWPGVTDVICSHESLSVFEGKDFRSAGSVRFSEVISEADQFGLFNRFTSIKPYVSLAQVQWRGINADHHEWPDFAGVRGIAVSVRSFADSGGSPVSLDSLENAATRFPHLKFIAFSLGDPEVLKGGAHGQKALDNFYPFLNALIDQHPDLHLVIHRPHRHWSDLVVEYNRIISEMPLAGKVHLGSRATIYES